MRRDDDVSRAREWLETWIGDFDDSEPYWARRVEGLADDFAAARAETFEAAAKECERYGIAQCIPFRGMYTAAIRALAKESAK